MFKPKFPQSASRGVLVLLIMLSCVGLVHAETDPAEANRRHAMAQLGEIEESQMLMERGIALTRERLIEAQQKARADASARGLLHLSEVFWSAYENSALLRDVFDANYKAKRGRHYAEAFLLAFEKRYQRQCADQLTPGLTLDARIDLPNIDWQIDNAGRVLTIRQGEPSTLDLAMPSALQAGLQNLIKTRISVHTAAALQTKLDSLNQVVSPNPAIVLKAKPNRLLSPEQGLDWWGKAEVDAARWFREATCASGEMQQMRRHVFSALGAPVLAVATPLVASIQDDLTALQDNSLPNNSLPNNSLPNNSLANPAITNTSITNTSINNTSINNNVRRSCMHYYGFDLLRADWCGCIDLSLHRDVIDVASDPIAARARYDHFRTDFRALLELGNLDLLNPDTDLEQLTHHPDWEFFRILGQCERKVL